MEDVTLVTDSIRVLFAFLDRIIYSFVAIIYNLTIKLASISIFDTGTLSQFSTKIYQVMGLFMLFKVSFSFLTYIVDPDAMSDKTKGAATIVKNIIIVLVMIIAAPFVFDKMAEAQKLILDEHILERFVFGNGTTGNHVSDLRFQMSEKCGDDYVTAASDGDFVALAVFSGFYQPETRVLDFDENMKELKSSEYLYCLIDSDLEEDSKGATVADYLHSDLYNRANGTGKWDIYDVNYMIIWSTIVGVALVLLFLNVCIDIAKRAVKLGFLELMAPIPIISYIDPKSGKDGMFKKWIRMLGSTWASLFVRLGSIYFAVYMVELIVQNMQGQSIWVKIFIIFGALMFAKELPKLLEELIPGLKGSGSFSLNPMKNIRENTIGGKAFGALGAAGLGFAGGMAANALAFKNRAQKDGLKKTLLGTDENGNAREFRNGQTGLKGFGAGINSIGRSIRNVAPTVLAGGASAGFNSFWSTSKSGKTFSGVAQGMTTSSNNRNLRRESGYNLWDKVTDKYTDLTGIKNSSGTTSTLKNKTNENNFKLENAKRDEAAATYALQELAMANNGKKFKEFQKAFESNSQINKDTHGIDVTFKYKNYTEYSAQNAGSPELLTKDEYDNYRSALDMRNSADSIAHQLQYENESISKQQQSFKGKK